MTHARIEKNPHQIVLLVNLTVVAKLASHSHQHRNFLEIMSEREREKESSEDRTLIKKKKVKRNVSTKVSFSDQ